MNPNEKSFNNQPATDLDPAHIAGNTPKVEQSAPQMANMPPQSMPSPSIAPHPQQASSQLPNNIKGLITACLTLGIAVVAGTILAAIGLAIGAFTSTPGVSMVSSLLIGIVYGNVRWVGLVLCVITFLSVLTAKKKQNIPIKKSNIAISFCSQNALLVDIVLLSSIQKSIRSHVA